MLGLGGHRLQVDSLECVQCGVDHPVWSNLRSCSLTASTVAWCNLRRPTSIVILEFDPRWPDGDPVQLHVRANEDGALAALWELWGNGQRGLTSGFFLLYSLLNILHVK